METAQPSEAPGQLIQTARKIFAEALGACSIEGAFLSKFSAASDGRPYAFSLRGGADEPVAEVDLAGFDRVVVISAGKGGATMLGSLLERLRLPPACSLSGVLVAPERPAQLPPGVEFFAGGHPSPNVASFRAAEAALALVRHAAGAEDRTFCFFLISGGASAMMELPLDASISLEDTVALYAALVHSGASIAEINCVRKHFSALKGGRLGQLAAGMPNLTVLVSDVPAGRTDALASGPTVPDSSTVPECLEILRRYDLVETLPPAVRRFFASATLPETPKPDAYPARVVTLLSDADLAEAARLAAESMGWTAIVDNACDDWEYRAAAEYLLGRLRELSQAHARICLISAGEVTVQVVHREDARVPAAGGRNQHFALYAATRLEAWDRPVAVFSAGSDGIDGNSPFAGAAIDRDLLRAADALATGSNDTAMEALAQFDSGTFLNRIGATIQTGPTGNNLRDLRLLMAG